MKELINEAKKEFQNFIFNLLSNKDSDNHNLCQSKSFPLSHFDNWIKSNKLLAFQVRLVEKKEVCSVFIVLLWCIQLREINALILFSHGVCVKSVKVNAPKEAKMPLSEWVSMFICSLNVNLSGQMICHRFTCTLRAPNKPNTCWALCVLLFRIFKDILSHRGESFQRDCTWISRATHQGYCIRL